MQQINLNQIVAEVTSMCQTSPIFTDIPPDQIERFVAQRANQARIILRGEALIQQGNQDRQFFLVVRGEMAAYDQAASTQRLLNYLEPGTFFGFRTLLDRSAKRAATVEAVVDSLVMVFLEDDWRWLLSIGPHVEEQVRKLEGEFENQAKLSFRGRQSDEITFLKARRHYLAFLERLVIPLTLLIVPASFLIILSVVGINVASALQNWLVWVVLLPFLIVSLLITIYHYFDWRNDEFILTSKRVIHIERILFYSEERREAPLAQIQSVTVKSHNWFYVILDVDDIEIQTAAIGKIFITNLQAAQNISRRILQAQGAAKHRMAAFNKARTRQMLRERLESDIMVETIPPPAEPKVIRRRLPFASRPKLRLGYFIPRTKEFHEKKITWRKHPFVLIRLVLVPALAVMGSFYFLLASFTGIWPFETPAGWFFGIFALAIFGFCLMWYTYRYDGWRRDVYILTDTKIIDVESSAFRLKGENVREGSFDSIQSITYNIPSWWEQLINLGDVTIKTAGVLGDFTFKRVFNPSSVQETIFSRWEQFQAEKRQKTQEESNLQTVEIVGQYDEIKRQPGSIA